MADLLQGYRDPGLLRGLAADLRAHAPGRDLCLMHVCGTHEHAIARAGLRSLLPDGVRIVAGPGCPVCVCPPQDIDMAVRLSLEHGVVLATFGDMVPVPGRVSLAEARARGGDVRVVASTADAIAIARREPDRQVVMLAVGFETTACTTAAALLAEPPENFTVLLSQRAIPPALDALLAMEGIRIDGFLLPGHVLTVTGTEPYEELARRSGKPMVVAGFEPVDVMLGLRELVRRSADAEVESIGNAYRRAVRASGNRRAVDAMERAFAPVDARWRGLGVIPGSGLALAGDLAQLDALRRFGVTPDPSLPDHLPGCKCGQVMAGMVEPEDCALFAKTCTPDSPRGPCMVSFEGTCRSRFLYREA